MSKQLFRKANVQTIKSLLQVYTGGPLANLNSFPKSYLVNQEEKENWVRLQMQYSDFQEAFCKFNLIARTCSQMNYYPEIFNVYNKIIVKLYSTNKDNEKELTAKDLYISYFLNELQSKNVEESHQNALEKVQALE